MSHEDADEFVADPEEAHDPEHEPQHPEEQDEEYVDTDEDEKSPKTKRVRLGGSKKLHQLTAHCSPLVDPLADMILLPPPPPAPPLPPAAHSSSLAPSMAAAASASSASSRGRKKRSSAPVDDGGDDGEAEDSEEDEEVVAEILLKYLKAGGGSDEDETLYLLNELVGLGQRELSLEEIARKKKLAEMASLTAWAISQTNARGGGLLSQQQQLQPPPPPAPVAVAVSVSGAKEKKASLAKKVEEKQNAKRELGELICARLEQVSQALREQQQNM